MPDLIDGFVPLAKRMLKHKNHGILICATALIIEMCQLDPSVIRSFRKMVPHLVRVFSDILQYGFSQDYDVGGITDPFLQVKLLRLLRILGHGHAEASDAMNVVLAGVATNTDNVRNVGNAILYECVNTIMGIDSESGLRILAINTLGRFLSNRDNNIRYVALNTLCNVVNIDYDAVQRHRNTVVECLKDVDISIRRRALELIYALVNKQNIRTLARELINFLMVADYEFRSDLTTKICSVTERFSPNIAWHVDTIIRVMKISGNYVSHQTTFNLLALIARTPSLQAYAVQKMYLSISEDIAQQTLVRVASWCIGEYGQYLLIDPVQLDSQDIEEQVPSHFNVTEEDIIELMSTILNSPLTTAGTKRFVLNALAKLTIRIKSAQLIEQIKTILAEYSTHINIELQQRSVEYTQILSNPQMSAQLLANMPAPELKQLVGTNDLTNSNSSGENVTPEPIPQQTQAPNLLDDLLDLVPSSSSQSPTMMQPKPQPTQSVDLLSSLFGPSTPTSTNVNVQNTTTNMSPSTSGLDLLSSLDVSPTSTSQPSQINAPMGQPQSNFPPIVAFNDANVKITFYITKPQVQAPQNTLINVVFENNSGSPVSNFEMKIAVPKYIKFQLSPASGNYIAPNATNVTQQIKLINSLQGSKPILMKLRVTYVVNGESKEIDCDVPNIPHNV